MKSGDKLFPAKASGRDSKGVLFGMIKKNDGAKVARSAGRPTQR
jgi:hypothetical protein